MAHETHLPGEVQGVALYSRYEVREKLMHHVKDSQLVPSY
jgi:hypothetical protein